MASKPPNNAPWLGGSPPLKTAPLDDSIDAPIDDQTVHLWEIGLEDLGPDDDALACRLPAEEQAIAARKRDLADRRRYLRAHAALRAILSTYVEPSVAFHAFRLGVHGKPSLASPAWELAAPAAPMAPTSPATGVAQLGTPSPPSMLARYATLEFNLAHSGSWALAAIGRAPLGVDVECVRPLSDWDGMIARCCSHAERVRLAQADGAERTRQFFHCWTGKEALLKGIGCGIAIDVRAIETPHVVAPHGTSPPLRPVAAPASLGPSTWQWTWFEVDERHVGAIAVGSQVRRIVRRPALSWSGTVMRGFP